MRTDTRTLKVTGRLTVRAEGSEEELRAWSAMIEIEGYKVTAFDLDAGWAEARREAPDGLLDPEAELASLRASLENDCSARSAICPECGPLRSVDDNGCCPSCGAVAMGPGIDRIAWALAAAKRLTAVDGPVYNRGRTQGQMDVAAELREILDPEDKNKLNLNGSLAEVRRLAWEANRAKP